MKHSDKAGGSTCERVIACPASVKMCAAMPPKPSSTYADEGTLLHNAMERIYGDDLPPRSVIGMTYEGIVLTEDLYTDKIKPAMQALDEIDPMGDMRYDVEAQVSFGDFLPGVFGSTDLVGRIGKRAISLDYKFGSGVTVDAEENMQGLFYVAAGMRTPALKWAYEGAEEIEIVIVQPPSVKRWVTTPARVAEFERDLVKALKLAEGDNPPLNAGKHCKWCAAKPTCPKFTGAAERALQVKIDALDIAAINSYLKNAEMLEGWITDLRALAIQMLENGKELPDYKLVQKQARRKWADENEAKLNLLVLGLKESDVMKSELVSPAVAEKLLKKQKIELPEELTTKESSGTTLANVEDPRPAVLQIGKQLAAALSKLQ